MIEVPKSRSFVPLLPTHLTVPYLPWSALSARSVVEYMHSTHCVCMTRLGFPRIDVVRKAGDVVREAGDVLEACAMMIGPSRQLGQTWVYKTGTGRL
jgi:hypothetical protein